MTENVTVAWILFFGTCVTAVFAFLGVVMNARITRSKVDIKDLQEQVAKLTRQNSEILSHNRELHEVNERLQAETEAWREWAKAVIDFLAKLPQGLSGHEIVAQLPPRPHITAKPRHYRRMDQVDYDSDPGASTPLH